MIPEVVFFMGAAAGVLAYHFLVARGMDKASREAISNATESMETTVGIREDLAKIQQSLENELEACRKMRQEMHVHIAEAEELSRVTGILSYAWPAEADVVIFNRTSGCCRGVDSTGVAPLVSIQDLFAKVPDLVAFTKELRAGVQRAPKNTGDVPAKDPVVETARV